jgi:hypothetical protein
VFFQQGMDNPALHANAPSMYDPDFTVSFQQRLMQIFFDKIGDLGRLKGMQVNRILNGQFHGFRHFESPENSFDRESLDFRLDL